MIYKKKKQKQNITQPGYAGTTTNLQFVLNIKKNPYLNQHTQKILTKVPHRKKPGIENFKLQKILQSSPVNWNLDNW